MDNEVLTPEDVKSLAPLYEAVVLALKQVYDPEIPVNIYDLGLIYDNPHMPTIIHTDETKLVQIITNIITNALKFTNKGHVIFGYSIIDSSIRFYVKDV